MKICNHIKSALASCNNLESVKLLKSIGLDRVVLAREMSLDNIKYSGNNYKVSAQLFGVLL